MDQSECGELLRTLGRLAARQDRINDEMRPSLQAQQALNERLTAAIERLDVTQAGSETLRARMIPPSENGREA